MTDRSRKEGEQRVAWLCPNCLSATKDPPNYTCLICGAFPVRFVPEGKEEAGHGLREQLRRLREAMRVELVQEQGRVERIERNAALSDSTPPEQPRATERCTCVYTDENLRPDDEDCPVHFPQPLHAGESRQEEDTG